MKLKSEQIKKMAQLVYQKLADANLIEPMKSVAEIQSKIESVILADAKKEGEIEAEAKKMMEKYRSQVESGEIDYQKMYGMIKKQLIKEKKFIP